jgi:hypothetical protein
MHSQMFISIFGNCPTGGKLSKKVIHFYEVIRGYLKPINFCFERGRTGNSVEDNSRRIWQKFG